MLALKGKAMGNLTALKVKSVSEPGRYQDGNGLQLVCKASGAKSWIVRIQANGRRRDIGLGSAAAVTLSEAREAALEARKLIRAGEDPSTARKNSGRILEQCPAFSHEADAFFAERKSEWSNPKHRDQWISTMRKYAYPAIGDKRVDRVTAADVRSLVIPIWQSKPETARRVLQRVCAVLNYSHLAERRDREAPVKAIRASLPRQTKRPKHFAALPYVELPKLMETLKRKDTIGRLALQFVILTAARSGEVRGANWDEIDFSKKQWCIPAGRMKARREHMIPLSQSALNVLKSAKQLNTTASEIVFPNAGGAALSDMTLLKVMKEATREEWTVHGCRSSFRDWAGETKACPSRVIEVALAHTLDNKTEAAYHRSIYLELRCDLMADWAAFLKGDSLAS